MKDAATINFLLDGIISFFSPLVRWAYFGNPA